MDLRTKTLAIFVAGLLIILAGFAVYSSSVLQKSYETIEKNEVRQDLQRVDLALENELDNLDSHLADWSIWDETYSFAQGNNSAYIEKNLPPSTFNTLDLDFILLFNQSKSLVYARAYNKTTGDLEPVSPLLLETITRDYPLFTFDSPGPDSTAKGILFVDGQPMAVAIRPVLQSNGDGPDEGVLIMGQNLDQDHLKSVSETTGVAVAFIDPVAMSTDPALASIQDQFRTGSQEVIQAANRDTVHGYTLEKQFNITPGTYLIEISEPRTIYQSGSATLYSFMLILLIAILVFGFVSIFIIDRMVLSRLSTITNDVRNIGAGNEHVRITQVPGNDELAQLSVAINQMLEQLSQSRLRYKSILEDQTEMICRFGLDGTITFMNPASNSTQKVLKVFQSQCRFMTCFNTRSKKKNWIFS